MNNKIIVGVVSAIAAAALATAISAGFGSYSELQVQRDQVSSLQRDIDKRDLRERDMREALIRVEERLKCHNH